MLMGIPCLIYMLFWSTAAAFKFYGIMENSATSKTRKKAKPGCNTVFITAYKLHHGLQVILIQGVRCKVKLSSLTCIILNTHNNK